jgi:hypothetical protein
MNLAASGTTGHQYRHGSRGAASALPSLRSLQHSYGYASVARLASPAHHRGLRTHTGDQWYCGDRPPSRSVLALRSSTYCEYAFLAHRSVRSDLTDAFHNLLVGS